MRPQITSEQAFAAGKEVAESYVNGMRFHRNRSIYIWRFEDAPPVLQQLSSHGGDEDWVVHISREAANTYLPGGLESVVHGDERSYLDGWGHVCKRELDNGDVVIIFAHA